FKLLLVHAWTEKAMWAAAARIVILVFGLWLPGQDYTFEAEGTEVEIVGSGSEPRTAARTLRSHRPDWVVFGVEHPNRLDLIFRNIAAVAPGTKLAVLGELEDLDSRDLWLGRGAHIFAREGIAPSALFKLMRMTEEANVAIFERPTMVSAI